MDNTFKAILEFAQGIIFVNKSNKKMFNEYIVMLRSENRKAKNENTEQ